MKYLFKNFEQIKAKLKNKQLFIFLIMTNFGAYRGNAGASGYSRRGKSRDWENIKDAVLQNRRYQRKGVKRCKGENKTG